MGIAFALKLYKRPVPHIPASSFLTSGCFDEAPHVSVKRLNADTSKFSEMEATLIIILHGTVGPEQINDISILHTLRHLQAGT